MAKRKDRGEWMPKGVLDEWQRKLEAEVERLRAALRNSAAQRKEAGTEG